MMLHICLAFRDESGIYTLHAAATVVSVLRHTAMPITLHIIHDESLQPQGRTCLEYVAAHFMRDIRFYDIKNCIRYIPNITVPLLGLGSLYRYCIPECIDATHVLYLDCDICCTCDVADIYAAILTQPNAPLACVLDDTVQHIPVMKSYVKRMGFNPKTYFNSGVLVLNIPVITALFPYFAQTSLKMTERFAHSKFKDQDVLNALFGKMPLHYLDARYNMIMHIFDRLLLTKQELQGKILHFCACKPWGDQIFPAIQMQHENYRFVEQIYKNYKKRRKIHQEPAWKHFSSITPK